MFNRRKKAFTLVELMIVLAIIAIVAAFAIPNLMKSRMSANETAAIGALRTIMSAQGTYMNRYNVYGTLSELSSEGLIDDSLAGGKKSGYFFGQVDDDSFEYAYCFGACPVEDGRSGQKEYCVTQEGTIYEGDLDSTAVDAETGTDWSDNVDVPTEFTTAPGDSASWTPISE
ncbi:MAG: prepilin-type N-terminal cleavage/methylation domain-containing protein [Planctomycetota bacterium]